MFTTHPSRRALSRIHAAIQSATGYGWADDNGGGGGGTETKSDDKQPDKGKQQGGDDADKVTLTKADRQKLIDDAKAEAKREADEKARKAKEATDAEEAKKRGEWETLAKSEETKRKEAEEKLAAVERTHKVERSLARAAAAQQDYKLEVFEEYVLPKLEKSIAADASDADIEKAVKEAVEKYVKDNQPSRAKGSAAAPAGPARTANRAAIANTSQNNDRPARRFRTLTYRG